MKKNITRKQRLIQHSRNVAMALLSIVFMTAPAGAEDLTDLSEAGKVANEVISSEGGKEIISTALKVARGKPALSVAGAITCLACVPVAGAASSPTICVACGILIAKVIG